MKEQMLQDIQEAMVGVEIADTDKRLLELGWQADTSSLFEFDEQSSSFKGQLRLRPIYSVLAKRYGTEAAYGAVFSCKKYVSLMAESAYCHVSEANHMKAQRSRPLTAKDVWG